MTRTPTPDQSRAWALYVEGLSYKAANHKGGWGTGSFGQHLRGYRAVTGETWKRPRKLDRVKAMHAEGLGRTEIACALGMSEESVRVTLYQAGLNRRSMAANP